METIFRRPFVTLASIALLVGASILVISPEFIYAQSGLKTAGRSWAADQRLGIDQISHDSFDKLLKKYVDGDGMVNYKSWHKSSEDRAALRTYIVDLSRANHSMEARREAKLAYWINAYNAVTLEGILAVYPTDSIRKHTSQLGYNIWDDLLFISGEKKLSLNDIEHKVLRKMGEPRIHFAIVCASIGCPRLLNQAYTAEQLEQQLVTNSTDFFSRSRNLQFDRASNQLKLSSILKWFASDFGSDTNRQIQTVSKYFPENLRKAASSGTVSVGYLDYDWNLNSQ